MGKWGWLPLIGSILGALVLVFGLPSTEGAPQEAVVVAVSVALAIIPYVFARAVSEINASEQGKLRRTELASLIAQTMPMHDEIPERDDNGLIRVPVIIRNPADTSRSWEGLFLVDTSATDSLVPGPLLSGIGITPKGQRDYNLVDGSNVKFQVSTVEIEIMGEVVGSTVVFVDADAEPLIGATALESAGLEVDLHSKTLSKKPSVRLR
jgi:clan AA aspartic protease